ncbi:MAG TPA: hypothetical protein VND94_04350 [Terriglobia bacterium]|nr:hypothetical protein [Terriglobia bacterium]
MPYTTPHRHRMAELMLQAAAERAALGRLVDEYCEVTGPFDRIYQRVTHIIRARPLVSTLLISAAGIAAVAISRRLPRLPLRGLIRGATLATVALRSLRGPTG